MKKLAVLIFTSLLSLPLRADLNDGIYAYLQGDYETAYNIMISLATTSEDKIAQYYLGTMYLKGQGIKRNYQKAGEWLRKASEQGLANAMYKLAELYSKGQGVPKDLEFAYIWYSVGAAHQHKKSMDAVDAAKTKLSPEELSAANQTITGYLEKYGPKPETTAPDAAPNEG